MWWQRSQNTLCKFVGLPLQWKRLSSLRGARYRLTVKLRLLMALNHADQSESLMAISLLYNLYASLALGCSVIGTRLQSSSKTLYSVTLVWFRYKHLRVPTYTYTYICRVKGNIVFAIICLVWDLLNPFVGGQHKSLGCCHLSITPLSLIIISFSWSFFRGSVLFLWISPILPDCRLLIFFVFLW